MSVVPVQKAGVGSAINNTFRQIGGALGVAVLGSVLATVYAQQIEPATAGLPAGVRAIARQSVAATQAVAGQSGRQAATVLASANTSFVTAMHITALVAAGAVALGGLLAAIWLPGRHPAPVLEAAPPDQKPAAESSGNAESVTEVLQGQEAESACELRGRVLRARGRMPVPGAALVALAASGTGLGRTSTDDDGHFVLTGLAGTGRVLLVSADGYRPAAVSLRNTDPRVEQEFVLTAAGALQGTVAGRTAPISGALVTLSDSTGTWIGRACTGTDGAFRFADLADGDYVLAASAAGYTPAAVAATTGRDEVNADLVLAPSAALAGVVEQSDGKAVGGATVELVDETGAAVDRTVTDRAGRYRFVDLPAGRYSVTVTRPVSVTSAVELDCGEQSAHHVRLDRPAPLASTSTITGGEWNAKPDGGRSTSRTAVAGAELWFQPVVPNGQA
jgi:hypothetical protein